MNVELTQFYLDCHRMTIYIDEEWIPSSEPKKVWERLLEVFDNDELIVFRVGKYCTQIPLAKHYIQKAIDIKQCHSDEHLLSSDNHIICVDTVKRNLQVKKNFVQSYISDGEEYELDYCQLSIVYDPIKDIEISVTWKDYVHDLLDSDKRSRILSNNSILSIDPDLV